MQNTEIKQIVKTIAAYLDGISYIDLTIAEKQIVNLLVKHDYMTISAKEIAYKNVIGE